MLDVGDGHPQPPLIRWSGGHPTCFCTAGCAALLKGACALLFVGGHPALPKIEEHYRCSVKSSQGGHPISSKRADVGNLTSEGGH